MKYRAKPIIVDAFRYGYDQWPRWFVHALETDVVATYEQDDPFEIPGVFIKRPHVIFCPHGSYLLLDTDGTVRYETEEVFQKKYEAVPEDEPPSELANMFSIIPVPSLLTMVYGEQITVHIHEYQGSYLFSFTQANDRVQAWYESIAYAVAFAQTLQEAASTIKEEIQRRFDESSHVDL